MISFNQSRDQKVVPLVEGNSSSHDGAAVKCELLPTWKVQLHITLFSGNQWRIYMVTFWTRPRQGPNCFNFIQFLETFGKIVCCRLSGGLAPPPLGHPGPNLLFWSLSPRSPKNCMKLNKSFHQGRTHSTPRLETTMLNMISTRKLFICFEY